MEPTVHLRSLMDSTQGVLLCLLIFITRGAVNRLSDASPRRSP